MKTEYFYIGQDIRIQISKDFQKKLNESDSVGDLFDELNDLITVDEINPNSGEHWLENSENVFSFINSDFEELKEKGFCNIYFIGTLNDLLDMNNEGDRNFYNWYYGKS